MLRNPRGPVGWAAPLHLVKPVEPGKDAAQASPCGNKRAKADWKESRRRDTKKTERIESLWWPGSGLWLPGSSWMKLPWKKMHKPYLDECLKMDRRMGGWSKTPMNAMVKRQAMASRPLVHSIGTSAEGSFRVNEGRKRSFSVHFSATLQLQLHFPFLVQKSACLNHDISTWRGRKIDLQ